MKKLLLCLFVWTALPAGALVVSPTSIDKQLAAAVVVADVTIETRQTISEANWSHLTVAHARVDQIVQTRDDGSSLPRVGEDIEIHVPGGERAGVGLMLSGLPRPYVGRSYRAYLKRATSSPNAYEVTGFERGFQPKTVMRAYTRNRTDGSNGDGYGPFLYWDPQFFPIPYYISAPTFQNLPAFADAVDTSISAWSAPADVKVSFIAMGCSTITRNANDGINNIILVTDSWPFDPDAIAITRNFYVADDSNRAGLILDSDILLNGVDHEFTTTNEPGKHDVQNIVTHESGHFIGMGHETDPIDMDATMYAVASPNEFNKRVLKADDLAGLHNAYAGVGPKMVPTHTRDNCQLVSTGSNLGCAAVHRRKKNPSAWLFLIAACTLIFFAGRVIRRSYGR